MKKTVSVTIFTLMISISMIAFNIQVTTSLEPLATEWDRTYGGAKVDSAYSVVQTVDGGYALAGATHSFGAGIDDFWLVKTNSTGHEQWSKTYGGTNMDGAWSIIQTDDDGYALTGRTWSSGAGASDPWLVKTDSAGNMEWNKTYGGAKPDRTDCIIQTADGGYALAGWTRSFGAGQDDFWLVKTNSTGDAEWKKTYGGAEWDTAESVVQTSDGGYALAGSTKSFGAGDSDFWLVKTDSAGNHLWDRTYGGTSDDCARSMIQTDDGGYALAGYTWSFGAGNSDFWLVKTDATGNLQWNQTYGGPGEDEARSRSMIQIPDGGYAITGFTKSFGAGSEDWWLVKTDADGNMQYDETYGGTSEDRARAIIQTNDGGYVISGDTGSFGAGGKDFWLIKLTDAHEYRKMIMIDNTQNPNTLTDYQVFINVTYDSDMQTDFDDLRFTWYNETSGEEVEIDYWLDKYVDSEYALVWVEVPEIGGAGQEVLYMYYHNPYAVSESNGEETFVFFDGFSTDTTANYHLWSPIHPTGNPNEFSWDPNGWLFVNASIRERPGRNSNVHVYHTTAVMDPSEDQYWLETRCKALGDGWLDYLGVCNLFKRDSMPHDVYFRTAKVEQGIRDVYPMNRSTISVGWGSWECGNRSDLPMPVIDPWFRIGLGTASNGTVVGSFHDDNYGKLATLVCHTTHQDVKWWVDLIISRILTDDWATMHAYFDYVRVRKFVDPEPTAVSAEDYIDNVDEMIQDLPDEIFDEASEDVPDIKTDFSDLFSDALENIEEGNYEGAVEKLNRIKEKIYEEIVESAERQELISMIDALIASIENLL